MDRREFIKNLVITGAAIPLGGLLSCSSQDRDTIISNLSNLSFSYQGENKKSVLELLKKIKPNVRFHEESQGILVTKIMGIPSGKDGYYWEFLANGNFVENAHSGNYITQGTDIIEWRYFLHQSWEKEAVLSAPSGIISAGCGSNQGYTQGYTEAQINSLILAEAARQNGWYTGLECKPWVKNVVYSSTKISLPATDTSLYAWVPSAFTRIVWQFKPANYCITNFPTYLLPGQIIQIKWRSTYMNGREHTIILSSISPTSISYWECNGNAGAYKVGSWKDFISTWQSRAEAWTVYQVKNN